MLLRRRTEASVILIKQSLFTNLSSSLMLRSLFSAKSENASNRLSSSVVVSLRYLTIMSWIRATKSTGMDGCCGVGWGIVPLELLALASRISADIVSRNLASTFTACSSSRCVDCNCVSILWITCFKLLDSFKASLFYGFDSVLLRTNLLI